MDIVYKAKSIRPSPNFYALPEFEGGGVRSSVNFSSSARFVETDDYKIANTSSPFPASCGDSSVHKSNIEAINNNENMNVRVYFKELDHT